MLPNDSIFTSVFDFLGTPISPDELDELNLSDKTMRRFHRLLKTEKERRLSVREQAQLEAFKEAVFFVRMGKRDH